jgi:tetratricopeptide (TPR) repeat protein
VKRVLAAACMIIPTMVFAEDNRHSVSDFWVASGTPKETNEGAELSANRADKTEVALAGTSATVFGLEAERIFAEAQLNLRAKEYDESALLFGRAARLNSRWKDPLIERAKINVKLSRFREAIEDCTQALAIDPLDASVLNLRGYAYLSLNQITEARSDLDQAISIKPDLADAYLNRGNLKWRLGEQAGANADFRISRLLRDTKHRK